MNFVSLEPLLAALSIVAEDADSVPGSSDGFGTRHVNPEGVLPS
jgi:hypothetical protein